MTNHATLERPALPSGKATQAGPDPITLEVVRNKLEGIANEMESTLLRSSFSPIVKEGLDASASLFPTADQPLAQAGAVPTYLAPRPPLADTLPPQSPPA